MIRHLLLTLRCRLAERLIALAERIRHAGPPDRGDRPSTTSAPQGPPVSGGPPAHWLEMVRSRAPHRKSGPPQVRAAVATPVPFGERPTAAGDTEAGGSAGTAASPFGAPVLQREGPGVGSVSFPPGYEPSPGGNPHPRDLDTPRTSPGVHEGSIVPTVVQASSESPHPARDPRRVGGVRLASISDPPEPGLTRAASVSRTLMPSSQVGIAIPKARPRHVRFHPVDSDGTASRPPARDPMPPARIRAVGGEEEEASDVPSPANLGHRQGQGQWLDHRTESVLVGGPDVVGSRRAMVSQRPNPTHVPTATRQFSARRPAQPVGEVSRSRGHAEDTGRLVDSREPGPSGRRTSRRIPVNEWGVGRSSTAWPGGLDAELGEVTPVIRAANGGVEGRFRVSPWTGVTPDATRWVDLPPFPVIGHEAEAEADWYELAREAEHCLRLDREQRGASWNE